MINDCAFKGGAHSGSSKEVKLICCEEEEEEGGEEATRVSHREAEMSIEGKHTETERRLKNHRRRTRYPIRAALPITSSPIYN